MLAAEALFRQFILNQRVDGTSQLLNVAAWCACGDPGGHGRAQGPACFAGLDFGATCDMTALVLVFADDDGAFDVVPFCWLPGDLRQREDEDRMPYWL